MGSAVVLLHGSPSFQTSAEEAGPLWNKPFWCRGGKVRELLETKTLKVFAQTWHMWSISQGPGNHMTKPNVNGAEMYTPPIGDTENPRAMNGDVYFSCRKKEWRPRNHNKI